MDIETPAPNSAAKELSRLGASKGGFARAEKISAEDRSAIAREAALSRWGRELPAAMNEGRMLLADIEIACAVLDGEKRVLSQQTFLRAVGRARAAKGGKGSAQLSPGDVPPFLADNLRPFISQELLQRAQPVEFRTKNGRRAYGYDALLLPLVCEVYLQARDAHKLRAKQFHIADACYLLMRGLARVGIVALVDEATGFQEERAKDELQIILAAYIHKELMPWTKRFPDEFFRHLYRLQGWEFRPGTAKRTPHVGKLINKYIYKKLPDGVLEELRRKNPVTPQGYRRYKHHQFLTEQTGHPHLDRQITSVMTIMMISDSRAEFEANFEKAFGKPPLGVQGRMLVIEPDGSIARPRLAWPANDAGKP